MAVIDEINQGAFQTPLAVKLYDSPDFRLFEAERVIFDRIRDEIAGKRLLDIGIGGGRTTQSTSTRRSASCWRTATATSKAFAETGQRVTSDEESHWINYLARAG